MFAKTYLYAAAAVCAGALLAACQEHPTETLAEARDDTPLEHARKHADPTYVCPMHPQIVRGEPGTCPICGMNLVLKEPETDAVTNDFGPPIVTIRPETLQNMGVRTAAAERRSLAKHIETVGYVGYDEDRIAHVHPRTSGWVEKLLVRAEGAPVERGQPLLEYYSPDLVNAQEEYLLALDGLTATGGRHQNLLQGARRRLRLLDIPEPVIDRLARTRDVRETVPILAPISGVVTEMGLREGMYIKPEMELLAITDVSTVWAQVDVFEHQMDWVKVGQPAEIRVPGLPGRVWKGKVDYVYPELDSMTRTLKVRLRFDNPDGALKPNMFAHAAIHGGLKQDVLTVPRAALIVTGAGERVILALGKGRFQPREVVSGMRVDDRVEILRGLEEGDAVVVSGQFLIDSESNLQASFRRMESSESQAGH